MLRTQKNASVLILVERDFLAPSLIWNTALASQRKPSLEAFFELIWVFSIDYLLNDSLCHDLILGTSSAFLTLSLKHTSLTYPRFFLANKLNLKFVCHLSKN